MFRNWITYACGVALALGLGACQGSSGTGGLSIPAPAYNAPAGPSAATTASRQQVLEGAVTLSPERTDIPLPALDGFSVSIALGSPAPATSPPSPGASASPGAAAAKAGAAAMATLAAAPSSTTSPAPAPSAEPSLAAAHPAAGSPSASPVAAAGKIVTKMTVYPDDAPSVPSPKPSGDVQTFTKRTPLVRGYIEPASDVSLYGLGAIRFTIPQAEQTAGRAFTVAVYTAGKKHHESLVAFDPEPTLADGVVASQATAPLVLKKATGYLLMLYADELPPTPAPAGNYPTPGSNPFPTQTPGAQGQPGYPGQPQQPGYSQPGVTAAPLR